MTQDHQSAEFRFSGKFLGYVFKDGYKIKRLMIATSVGDFSIKMTKTARASLTQTLLPGDQIQVGGWQKFDRKTKTLKFKAEWIQATTIAAIPVPSKPKAGKDAILMCQKPSCMKRGGKQMCRAIETALSERGLEDQVTVKATGCMKACGKVPVVFMPEKTRYTKLKPEDIGSFIDEHFTPQIAPAPQIEPAIVPVPTPVLVSV